MTGGAPYHDAKTQKATALTAVIIRIGQELAADATPIEVKPKVKLQVSVVSDFPSNGSTTF